MKNIVDKEECEENKPNPETMGKDLSDNQVLSTKEAFTLFDTNGMVGSPLPS